MKNSFCVIKPASIFLVVLLLSNCVAVQPFPLAARAGDTITVAAGSADGMTASNTTATFTSDAPATLGQVYDLTSSIRAVTKIYPDKTSMAWTDSIAGGMPYSTGHGSWQTVVLLDLDPSLPIGAGHLNITTTAPDTSPFFIFKISDVSQPLEILPGTGVSNDFLYKGYPDAVGDFSLLNPRKQAIITNGMNGAAGRVYGAIEVVVNAAIADISTGNAVADDSILVVPDDQPQDSSAQKQLSWKRSGNEITIIVMSPKGSLNEFQLRSSIVIPESAEFTTPPTVASTTYYDINGSVITGPTPSVALVP
jgi:hypothetical protein